MHVIAGGAAGACAAAITTPLDVVKTLLNTQETGLVKGMKEAIRKVCEYKKFSKKTCTHDRRKSYLFSQNFKPK